MRPGYPALADARLNAFVSDLIGCGCFVPFRFSATMRKKTHGTILRFAFNASTFAALEALKGSLVLLSHASSDSVWQFKHPTIGDAYAAILVQSPEHIGIFIQGSAPERLVDQVTCGDVGIEKAVVVPRALFSQMLEKLGEISKSKSYKSPWLSTFGAKRDLQGFLARRCSKEFLEVYLERNPGLLDQVSEPGLFSTPFPKCALRDVFTNSGSCRKRTGRSSLRR